MKIGRRALLSGMLGVTVAGALPALPAWSQGTALRLDFGGTTPAPAPGYTRALTTHTYTAARGWGWVSNAGLASRDRGGPAPLQRDFIFFNGVTARSFRVGNLAPGRYRLSVLTGDLTFGDHYTRVQLPGIDGDQTIPVVRPGIGQFATITATFVVPAGKNSVDITFDATQINWVVNALVVEPTTEAERVRVTFDMIPPVSKWGPVATTPDATAALLDGHRARVAEDYPKGFAPTGLTRSNYLDLITGEVDFWKTQQNTTTGAIVDPYRNVEFQYSTPAYAHAASTLVAYAGRTDLIETAALALDWSAQTLSLRKAASGHEDFFAPMIAHSIRLLKPFVSAERAAKWEYNIWSFEPFMVYRYGAGVNNWNVVAATGEALFQMMGIRDASHRFAEASFAAQGVHFNLPYGLYTEGPMAYDLFPRLWVSDLIGRGYTGPYSKELGETLRRGAVTSLFLQSPLGELPAGGRSAHHQWNEAEQCVVFEIYAARALANGDTSLAAYFKRGAHLSLASMRRWVRPSGEMQIVKNYIDPAQNHGYETYSAHSQYNLLPMSMLAIAFEHAETTEGVSEKPAPADAGGYVFEVPELHKVIANAGGAYVEIDTTADHDYDATGLIRVNFTGNCPQLGPSASVLAHPKYVVPEGSEAPYSTGIGVSWLGTDGAWHHQGELSETEIQNVTVTPGTATSREVAFTVRYQGNLGGGVSVIEDQFTVTPDEVRLTTLLPGFTGAVRRVVPILANDGRTESKIQVHGDEARVWRQGELGTSKHTFEMEDASQVTVTTEQYGNNSGWASLAVGEYPVSTSNGNNGNGNGKGKGKGNGNGSSNDTGYTLVIGTQGGRHFI